MALTFIPTETDNQNLFHDKFLLKVFYGDQPLESTTLVAIRTQYRYITRWFNESLAETVTATKLWEIYPNGVYVISDEELRSRYGDKPFGYFLPFIRACIIPARVAATGKFNFDVRHDRALSFARWFYSLNHFGCKNFHRLLTKGIKNPPKIIDPIGFIPKDVLSGWVVSPRGKRSERSEDEDTGSDEDVTGSPTLLDDDDEDIEAYSPKRPCTSTSANPQYALYFCTKAIRKCTLAFRRVLLHEITLPESGCAFFDLENVAKLVEDTFELPALPILPQGDKFLVNKYLNEIIQPRITSADFSNFVACLNEMISRYIARQLTTEPRYVEIIKQIVAQLTAVSPQARTKGIFFDLLLEPLNENLDFLHHMTGYNISMHNRLSVEWTCSLCFTLNKDFAPSLRQTREIFMMQWCNSCSRGHLCDSNPQALIDFVKRPKTELELDTNDFVYVKQPYVPVITLPHIPPQTTYEQLVKIFDDAKRRDVIVTKLSKATPLTLSINDFAFKIFDIIQNDLKIAHFDNDNVKLRFIETIKGMNKFYCDGERNKILSPGKAWFGLRVSFTVPRKSDVYSKIIVRYTDNLLRYFILVNGDVNALIVPATAIPLEKFRTQLFLKYTLDHSNTFPLHFQTLAKYILKKLHLHPQYPLDKLLEVCKQHLAVIDPEYNFNETTTSFYHLRRRDNTASVIVEDTRPATPPRVTSSPSIVLVDLKRPTHVTTYLVLEADVPRVLADYTKPFDERQIAIYQHKFSPEWRNMDPLIRMFVEDGFAQLTRWILEELPRIDREKLNYMPSKRLFIDIC